MAKRKKKRKKHHRSDTLLPRRQGRAEGVRQKPGGSSIAQLISRYLYSEEGDEAREKGAEAFRRYRERKQESGGYDPYRELGITPDASDEVVRAAYKAEARRRHPDRGGSNEEMERLNAAFAEIKKRRGMR